MMSRERQAVPIVIGYDATLAVRNRKEALLQQAAKPEEGFRLIEANGSNKGVSKMDVSSLFEKESSEAKAGAA